MSHKELWNDEFLTQFAKSLIQCEASNYEGKQFHFWYEDKNGELKINKTHFLHRFLPTLGIRNLVIGNDAKAMSNSTPVFIRGKRVEQMNVENVTTVVNKVLSFYDYILGDMDDDDSIGEVVTTLIGYGNLITKKTLTIVKSIYDNTIMKDDAHNAYRFFKNGWVSITEKGVSGLRSYDELPEGKLIWNSSVIDRDFVSPEDATSSSEHFRDFIENLSKENEVVNPDNLNVIKKGIGYLCHNFRPSDCNKWVVALDRNFDPNRKKSNGGNGKSILFEALERVMNTADVDGTEFVKNRSDKFAFAKVNASTELVFIDDANKDFDWKRLYSRTTGSFMVRKATKDPFYIPKSEAPKICVSSNFPIPDDDPSTLRRTYLIEVSDFYWNELSQNKLTPKDIHGGKFIADIGEGEDFWDNDDWNAFYRYIWECIALYLKEGLPVQIEVSPNQVRSRLLCLMANIDEKDELLDFFIEKLNEYAKSDKDIFSELFYRQLRKQFQYLPNRVTNSKLMEWFKQVGKSYGLLINEDTNSNLRQARLINSKGQPNEVGKLWKSTGMSDWRDKNGNDPLKDTDLRVYVFNVVDRNTPQKSTPTKEVKVKSSKKDNS